ncbi:DUF2796 domain-containing protein [Pseudomonas sp. MM211]|uniref:DUF2796 domain-containing protein n=1 Tax=Pseudomonas sp. MM211 TaxID=2866808 RepID=UPI001CEDA3D7|nr:DUF2796 domain-containing protein [Pseudomonas sp. MM211]UCJ18364.1 DUF2796 domain-containing protein [Pseudomonas sp. MM211]
MRRLLLALPFALLPLAAVHAQNHDHDHDHEHGSLGKHEHGVATLNVALEGNTLEIELESPAMNIVGFEHAATSEADKKTVAAARALLEKPLALFSLPAAAGCSLTEHELQSPLFGNAEADHDHDHDHDEHADGDEHHHEHSDIDADYSFTCKQPGALKTLDLSAFYKQFPATQKINVQLIGPSGQQGVESTPANAQLTF